MQNGQNNPSRVNTENPYSHQNGHTVELSDDEYIDSVEDTIEMPVYRKSRASARVARAEASLDATQAEPVLQKINQTFQRMHNDMVTIVQRFNALEKDVLEMKRYQAS